jgi:hypothetical protein
MKMKVRKRKSRGLVYSLLAIGVGAAVYGVAKNRNTKLTENNQDPNYEPDNPEIFNYYY